MGSVGPRAEHGEKLLSRGSWKKAEVRQGIKDPTGLGQIREKGFCRRMRKVNGLGENLVRIQKN